MITVYDKTIRAVHSWYNTNEGILLDIEFMGGQYLKNVSLGAIRFNSVFDLVQWERMTKEAKETDTLIRYHAQTNTHTITDKQKTAAIDAVRAVFYKVFEDYVSDLSNGYGDENFKDKADYKQVKSWAELWGLNIKELEHDILSNYDEYVEELVKDSP